LRSRCYNPRKRADTITGVVSNGTIILDSPLPEGTRVAVHLTDPEVNIANPLLHFSGHLDPSDPAEQEFLEELAR
jgi:hypothetical protein